METVFLFRPPCSRADQGSVSEWLRSRTRNPMGFARGGSNPLAVVIFDYYYFGDFFEIFYFKFIFWKIYFLEIFLDLPICHRRKTEPRVIRTPNRLIWSQTRYRCAMDPECPSLIPETEIPPETLTVLLDLKNGACED
jgi:hypothetical protein